VNFALTDYELTEALRASERRPDGTLVISLPASRLVEASAERVDLSFDDLSRTVTYGRQSVHLERTPYKLLKEVWGKGRVDVTDLELSVWGREEVSDSAIRNAISRVNRSFESAGFPIVLDHHKGRLFVERLG
jgi:DNA-binding response OmpR family regulator